jgi:metallo-beta-lactamase class B
VVIELDGIRAEAYFPGAAHAPDDIVVWLPQHRILAGTCMIRSGDATSLGYLGDASLATWSEAVRAVQRRFSDIAMVVPGHGEPGPSSLLDHTIELVRATPSQ